MAKGTVGVFIAVAVYISVGFLEQSALPSFLAHVEVVAHPNATMDEISHAVTSHMAACSLSLGLFAVTVAGWAGRLSDRFGRRSMAVIPAVGQAIGMALVALAAYYELDWRYVVAAWAAQGLFGGPFVFLAAAFAYLADHKKSEAAKERGRAFAALDSLLLFVAAVGPFVGGLLVRKVGFSGAFGLCALIYFAAALAFALAPPSPQRPAQPSSTCNAWLLSSTPALLWRMLRTPKMRPLCAAFLLAMGGLNGGAISVVFYGQRYLGWGQQQIGYYIGAFSVLGGLMIVCVHPTASWLLGRPISDLTMVRFAYILPLAYFMLLAALPRKDVLVFALLPLFAAGPTALPHFRALFSRARPDDAQGEQMSLVAALESLPQLYSAPLASLAFNLLLHQPWIVLLGAGILPIGAMLVLWLGVSQRDHAPQLDSMGLLAAAAINDPAAADVTRTAPRSPHEQAVPVVNPTPASQMR